MSGDKTVAEADEVSVKVDAERMFRFTPVRHDYRDGLSTLASGVMRRTVGLPVQAMLSDAANGARQLQVIAFPYEDAIPATGLKEALDDLTACRMSSEA